MSNPISSPFVYRPATIQNDKLNKDGNITFKEINTLVNSGLLFPMDFEILKIVANHRYISKAHIEWILCSIREFNGQLKSETVKRRVRFLCTHGLLLRKYFQYRDYCEGETASRAANFYEVSRGALAYMKRTGQSQVKDIESYLAQESVSNLCRRFAVNQLIGQFVKKGISYSDITLAKIVNANGGGFLKGLMSPKTYVWAAISSSDNSMEIYIEPVRRDSEWKALLVKRMESLQRITKGTDGQMEDYKLLFIAEDDAHLIDVFDMIESMGTISNRSAYTTDIALLAEDLTSSIFKVSKTLDGHIIEEYGNKLLTLA